MSKNKKNSTEQVSSVDSKDFVVIQAKVDTHCKGVFNCLTSQGQKIVATPSGKMRQNDIHILPGDMVEIQCSPYDTNRGRIVRRMNTSR